jgi:hypothetical protein
MAHITGGGLVENVPRVLGDKLTAVLHKDAWTLPPLFTWLQQHGGVADAEMHRVFNCGIGMVVLCRCRMQMQRWHNCRLPVKRFIVSVKSVRAKAMNIRLSLSDTDSIFAKAVSVHAETSVFY